MGLHAKNMAVPWPPLLLMSPCRMRVQHVIALLLAIGCMVQLSTAGGYGRGKPHRLGLYPKSEWYMNHSPAPASNSVPGEFNWCSHEGVNYCTSSWNQHIPR